MLIAVGIVDAIVPVSCEVPAETSYEQTTIQSNDLVCQDNIDGDAENYIVSGVGTFLLVGGFAGVGGSRRKEDEEDADE